MKIERLEADEAGAPASEEDQYLRQLGQRIFDLRVRRGMTRKILSRDSGVSERFLAQLEAGDGNISIIRLRRIAKAMDIPLEELLRTGPEPLPELTLLVQYLTRLSPARLNEARDLLISSFETRGRRGRIALIGLRGAGKTTLGKMLAEHLKLPFIEMTKFIERDAGMMVSEIFSLSGQAAYRRYERRALQSAVKTHERFVLSPGGSIVTEPATFDELLTSCYTIWLKASPQEHMARVIGQGDRRPMKDNREAMKDLARILAGREAMYVKADAAVDTTGLSLQQSFEALLKAVPA
ncbi:Shikimate kinase [Burkholderiales bacterium]|nr:Shikimate kinase [Burkholderiales bacterium]